MTRTFAAISITLLFAAPRATAQQSEPLPGFPALRLRTDTLKIETTVPSLWAGRLRASSEDPVTIARAWEDSVRARIAAVDRSRWRAARMGDTTAFAVPARPAPAAVAAAPSPARPQALTAEGVARYAELGIQVNALFDLRFDKLKNLRCTAGDVNQLGNQCRGGFNPPTVEPQFGVLSGGVVGQRVHVSVDYDTRRQFDASNNIQVFYQGLTDEILRRVEVGNVTFAAPSSRFITGGIPSNNFGVAMAGQLGALDFGAIFAQQKGNVSRARVFTVGDQTVQPVDRFAADRDFEPLRFFFVRDPRTIPGYPAVDVLGLSAAALPQELRVVQVRIYRRRSAISRATTETNLSGIQAVALRRDSQQRAGPVTWEVLTEGRDYYVDPSGLWFALAARLDQDDFLAVSYITARGDTVGTFPAQATSGRVDTLELIYAPRTGPEVPTFFYEMRNVYRVGAVDDVVRTSVASRVLVGGSERPAAGAPTFLSLLGLAQESDATTFDQYNRLFPRQRDPALGAPLREYFIIFPSLTPFADATRLPQQYRTDSLYRTPTYLLRTQGPAPLFQLGLHYDAKGGDTRGTLLLGGYQIRQGSERVMAGGRQLVRNSDYTINYELGQITFTNPDELFPRPTQVTVQFEENAAFAVAPTSIYGLQGRYDLGDHGSLSFLGIMQRQRTTFTRPPLGFEPASNAVAGITANFRFEPRGLTRLLDALPLLHTEAPSTVTLDAEIATSRPSPNQVGVAYVETFEGEAGQSISLAETSWQYGSRPSSANGLAGSGLDPGAGFRDEDAVVLTWQNLIAGAGNTVPQLLAQDIDPSIRVQGAGQTAETVLWMALHPDTLGGLLDARTFQPRWVLPHVAGPRWRSVSQPLSATGVDLSRTEYLEFWVLEDDQRRTENAGTSLVFDFGRVYEDAVDFHPAEFRVAAAGDTVFSGRVRAGEGRLDTERDTLTGTFNAAVTDHGILGDVADSIRDATRDTVLHDFPLCRSALSQGLIVYSWGSAFAHCTRGNGRLDTEDLDNDQHLDTLVSRFNESVFRYVVKIGDPRYVVREGGTVGGVGRWRLYRIPFRADTVQVGTPDFRQIRALRLTVIVPGTAAPESTLFFALARVRLVGSPWLKRAGSPIPGLAGLQGAPHGEVVASVVSTENRDDLGYAPPPGVTDLGANVGGGIQLGSTEINERSLRLVATGLMPGERAEAYFRFPEGNKNFLGYRELRVWARGRGAGWEGGDLTFLIKVGQDENNFYLYRAPIHTASWEPEVVVDFGRWFALRSALEQRYLSGQPPSGAAQCGGDTLAYVACDGPYLVHMRSPSVAPPNLTRVQELAVGILKGTGPTLDSAELWVDDIRLTDVVNTPGYAGAVNLNVTAADVADLTMSLSRRDGNFRQLGDNPSYVTSNQFTLGATVRLERFGLDRLGLTAPLVVRTDHSSQDPYFLTGTDVLAGGLADLRRPDSRSSSYSISLRRSVRGVRWWEQALLDPLSVSGAWSTGSSRTELSTSRGSVSDLRADYSVAPKDVSVRFLPGFLQTVLGVLPGFLQRSELVRGLRDSRLHVSPARITFTASLTKSRADRSSFRVPIASPFDPAQPVLSTSASFRQGANLDFRPFGSMSLGMSAAWDRDLKDYGDSTVVGAVATTSRSRFLGADVGFVRQRSLGARFTWNPTVALWLRPRMQWSSGFSLARDPNAGSPERSEGDSAGAFRLPTVFASATTTDLTLPVDLPRALRGLLGDSSALRRAIDRISQLDLGRHLERRSQFNRPGFDPGLSYQLGLLGRSGHLAQQGRLATAAGELTQDRLAWGLRLPLGFTVNGAYSKRVNNAWFLRGTELQLQKTSDRDWPGLTARWVWSPRSGWLRRIVSSVNATVGSQRRTTETLTPTLGGAELGAGALLSTQDTRATPVSVSVSWAKGISTSFGLSGERSIAERAGNVTRGDRRNTSADVRFSFRPPPEFIPLPGDIRTALRWSSSLNSTCVLRSGTTDCLSIAESHRTEYNLTMETDMPPNASGGLSVGYVLTDDRHTNRKFSQFTLTVTVRMFFTAGEIH